MVEVVEKDLIVFPAKMSGLMILPVLSRVSQRENARALLLRFYGIKEPDDTAGNGEPPAALPKGHNTCGPARPHAEPSGWGGRGWLPVVEA